MSLWKSIPRLAGYLLLAACLALMLWIPGERAAGVTPTLSLTVSNPYCVQLRTETGVCQINIRGITATSTGSLERITISINNKVRFNLQGFFDSSGYFSNGMIGSGLRVVCGRAGAGGNPAFGNLYSVQIQANLIGYAPYVDTANTFCPYYDGKNYLPMLAR